MLNKLEQDTFYQKIGSLIKAKRQQAGTSQEELSKTLGFISRISVANIESGKQKVQLHTLVEIAEFLKLPVSELIPAVETGRKDVNPKLLKMGKEPITDPQSVEKMSGFIRISKSKK